MLTTWKQNNDAFHTEEIMTLFVRLGSQVPPLQAGTHVLVTNSKYCKSVDVFCHYSQLLKPANIYLLSELSIKRSKYSQLLLAIHSVNFSATHLALDYWHQ